LACATLKLGFLGVLLGVALVALIVQRVAARHVMGFPSGGILVVALPKDDVNNVAKRVTEFIESRVARGRLESLSTNTESTVISYAFHGSSDMELVELQSELTQYAKGSTVDIFLNRTSSSTAN